jgi:hypothetical protein
VAGYTYPLPSTLYKPLCSLIVRRARSLATDSETGSKVRSIQDHGRKVDFTDFTETLLSGSDSDVFASIKPLLDRYKLATVY